MNGHGVRLFRAVRAGKHQRERVILIQAVAVGKNGQPHRDAHPGAGKRDGFAGSVGACGAWRVEIKAAAVGRKRDGAWQNTVGGRDDKNFDERICQVTVPIHQDDTVLIQ
jgi:hypothetical protein